MTAAICTFNEAPVLADAVESLLRQSMPAGEREVLIIDNGSTDQTQQIATGFAERHEDVRLVSETRRGLSVARNRAMSEASAPLIAFMDADAVAEPSWLESLALVFETDHTVSAAGGPIRVRWDHERPRWWDDRLNEALNALDLGGEPQRLTYPTYPYGTNFAVRRDLAQSVGGFAQHLGRQGRKLAAAEEGELCLRLEQAGWQIAYTPEAVVHHRTAAGRLSRRYLLRRAFGHGRSQQLVERQYGLHSGGYLSWSQIAGKLLGHAATGRLNWPFLKYITFRIGYHFQRSFGSGTDAATMNLATNRLDREAAEIC